MKVYCSNHKRNALLINWGKYKQLVSCNHSPMSAYQSGRERDTTNKTQNTEKNCVTWLWVVTWMFHLIHWNTKVSVWYWGDIYLSTPLFSPIYMRNESQCWCSKAEKQLMCTNETKTHRGSLSDQTSTVHFSIKIQGRLDFAFHTTTDLHCYGYDLNSPFLYK